MSASTLSLARLRDDLVVVERTESGKRYVYVKDPHTGKVFGFPGRAYDVLRATPARVENPRVAELFARALRLGLLDVAAPVAAQEAAPARKWKTFNPIYFRIGVVDPTPVLQRLEWLFRALFSPIAVTAGFLLFTLSVALVVRDGTRFWWSFLVFRDFRAWATVNLAFSAIAILHELGHAMSCTRFGGRVRSVGFLFYLFRIGCFTDVSDAWLMNKRQRVLIAMAGVYMEMLVLSVTLAAWLAAAPFSPLSNVCFVLSVVLATHIPINLLPFLRLDGYFVLADVLEIKNLRPKAFAYLVSLAPVIGRPWRAKSPPPARERWIFLAYGTLSVACVAATLANGGYWAHRWLMRWNERYGSLAFAVLCAAVLVPSLVASVRGLRAQRNDLEGAT